ncbi:MAG: site-specific DNA-methyltransferase [Anaerolineaceae bacterium]|nr:site-specific DNA-methyltransferase [Anaerolineaceae bacterium]
MVELVWDGKYNAEGKRVAPLRVALPFQTVETVNESAQQRQMTLDLFSAGRDAEWRNRLIWGDKKYVLPSLLPEFAGKVDLIYIDPPFATGANFSFSSQVSDEDFIKQPSIIEQKAYRDTWGKGLDSYAQWFYETAQFLHELLSDTGSIYVHCDWRINGIIKFVLDEVFGSSNALNQIIWKRVYSHSDAKRFGIVDDNILFYSKSENYIFNKQYKGHAESYIKSHYGQVDENGRRFRLVTLSGAGPGPSRIFGERGEIAPPKGRHWAWSQERIDDALASGKIVFASTGQPNIKQYLDETEGTVIHTLWDDVEPVNPISSEIVGYPTQKPEALLERIIRASSNDDALILDCFCGSGTTAAVAERLNRRWITCDLGRFAIHTARKRLLGVEGVRPFVVQNLGKYERQVWQKAEFGERAEQITQRYRHFILDLYHAEPVEGYVWLHGKKGGRMVHVGTVDAPIVRADVSNIAADFRRSIGTGKNAPKVAGVDVLGWDFALDMNETVKEEAQASGIDVRFIRIPREILESKAVEQGDIRFFELAALSTNITINKRDVRIELTDFMIPPDDVPEEVIKAVSHWSEWIDYWAVDFNYRDDTFHNEWQSYRSRKDRSLQLSVNNHYDQPGTYTVLVKVIDILGNDTTKAVTVEVR